MMTCAPVGAEWWLTEIPIEHMLPLRSLVAPLTCSSLTRL